MLEVFAEWCEDIVAEKRKGGQPARGPPEALLSTQLKIDGDLANRFINSD